MANIYNKNHVTIGYNKQPTFNLILKRPNKFLSRGGGEEERYLAKEISRGV
jgi:hypothetical protein